MNKAEIRAAIFSKTLKTEEIANILDIFPELVDSTGNALVALRELNGTESKIVSADPENSIPKLLALALIVKETKEQVFDLPETGSIMDAFGSSVIQPLATQALKLSGMTAGTVADAKNA